MEIEMRVPKRACMQLVAALGLGAAACSSGPSALDDGDPQVERAVALEVRHEAGIVLLTQVLDPTEAMEALYQDRVVIDDAGCIRLSEAGEPITAVWPKGFTARPTIEGPEIMDADGELVGRVGEHFTFGGGVVPFLHEGFGFTESDQALAVSRCPGAFWIVTPSTVSSP